MKNLTEKQQQIVDSLIEEFTEINLVEAEGTDNDSDGWNDPEEEAIDWSRGFDPIISQSAAETRAKVRAFLNAQRRDIAGYIKAARKYSISFRFIAVSVNGNENNLTSCFVDGGFDDGIWDEIVGMACDRAVHRLASNDSKFTLFRISFGYNDNGSHGMECVVHGMDVNADYANHLKLAPIKDLKSPSKLRDLTGIVFNLNGYDYNTPKEAYNNDISLRRAISNVIINNQD
jgi:hypothetical protein